MNSYLKETKKLLSEERKPLMVVIGNESVDLDSAVSSLSLAYHLNKVKCKSKIISNENKLENFFVLPIINAKKVELPIKTEVTHWIIKNNIELSNLICRDEINLDDVDKFILVDHHVSVFRDKCWIIDHLIKIQAWQAIVFLKSKKLDLVHHW
ncbi:CLUMA_CG011716, isoform A [Clunio marinus]|uniref:CLUMA_CG011716, isoform A n=1 Tax=Clunio marinus TaxID=568069 RepID=A0A1J1IFN6_9DIPT|nr:CLUMA_CG011716, isoform A [Clunio marinus]